MKFPERGRAEQVQQQKIANLIAISASPLLSMTERHIAAKAAAKALGVAQPAPTPEGEQ